MVAVWPEAVSEYWGWSTAGERRDCADCGEQNVEVHHVDPIPPGGVRNFGCWNHQDNLVVLCRTHHQEVHNRMRGHKSKKTRPVGRARLPGMEEWTNAHT